MKTLASTTLVAVALLMPTMAFATSPLGVYAHKNSVDQSGIPNNQYTLVTFNNTKFNGGSYFNTGNSAWAPSAGLVYLSGQITITAGASGKNDAQFVAKIIKNGGQDVCAGIGIKGPTAGSAIVPVSCVDNAAAGDSYQIFLYASTDSSVTVSGNPALTWFSAATLPGSNGAYLTRNSVDQQNIPNNQFTLVGFNSAKFDVGGNAVTTTSSWNPPPGPVLLSGQVWLNPGTVDVNGSFVAKVVKNGTKDVCAGDGTHGSFTGTASIPFSCVDVAVPGDYYQVYVYASSNASSTINGHPAHTWFSMATLPSWGAAYAHKNYIDQIGVPNAQFTAVTFGSTRVNVGNYFTSDSMWAPSAGITMLSGQILLSSGALTSGGNFTAKIVKNGTTDVCAGLGTYGSTPGSAAIPFSCVDMANTGDRYQVLLYATTNGNGTVASHPALTWFSAASQPVSPTSSANSSSVNYDAQVQALLAQITALKQLLANLLAAKSQKASL